VRIHLVTTGRYLTFLPDDLLQFVGRRWSLKILPIDLGIQAPSLGVLTLRNRTLSPVAQLFIDCARDIAKLLAGGTAVRTVHRGKPNVFKGSIAAIPFRRSCPDWPAADGQGCPTGAAPRRRPQHP
jgi:hypothetical protein